MGLVLVTTLVGVVLVSGHAHAGQNEVFGAEPTSRAATDGVRRSFDIPERSVPGVVFEDSLRVYNRSSEPIRLRIYPAAAAQGPDGVMEIGVEPGRSGLAARIDVARSDVVLGPLGETTVDLAVTTTGGVLPAGSLAAIVVEGAPSASTSELDLVQRIAILVRPSGAVVGAPQRSSGGVPGWIDVMIGVSLLASYRWRKRRPAADRKVSV